MSVFSHLLKTFSKKPALTLTGTFVSDVGPVRKVNEDRALQDETLVGSPKTRKAWVAIIADGMGGHAAGDVASQLAIDTVMSSLSSDEVGTIPNLLEKSIQIANRTIFELSKADPSKSGMGTTITAVMVDGNRTIVGHVGDSRAYLIRGGQIRKLTTDHSVVGQMLSEGMITESEAQVHPDRNLITRALGTDPVVKPDISELNEEIEAGDLLCLCTDGLHGVLGDQEILAIATSRPPARACHDLIAAAVKAGTTDNVSVGLFRVANAEKGVTDLKATGAFMAVDDER